MATKIRLSGDEPAVTTASGAVTTAETSATSAAPALSSAQTEQLMKYAEAIDWKLWEILKLLRKHTGE